MHYMYYTNVSVFVYFVMRFWISVMSSICYLLDQWRTRDTGWNVRDTTFSNAQVRHQNCKKYATKIAKQCKLRILL